MKMSETTARHEEGATRGYVVWIVAYAAIMVCLFAFQDGGNVAPDLMPTGFSIL